ncbi:MAG: glycosyltransferase [Candidatus Bathyarchaeota archaeon]|nr:glycosyltransferase [Candidatus Bathyarchaeota archaeon]
MSADGVSVVTTTWNESKNIERLVAAIRKVLQGYPHEIIVVDDSSDDCTLEAAKRFADVAVSKPREGQSRGLLFGMRLAKYPKIVTIDADLENDPKHIPQLLQQMDKSDVVVASRTKIPRFSEQVASKTLGKLMGVTDSFSNFRAFRRENVPLFVFRAGETFGAEFLIIAKKNGLKISEICYTPPPRRSNPRIGGTLKANLRIFWVLSKSLILYAS